MQINFVGRLAVFRRKHELTSIDLRCDIRPVVQIMQQQRHFVPSFHFDPEKPCYCGKGLLFGRCCGAKKSVKPVPEGIFVVPGFVSPGECRQLIRYFEKQKREWLKVSLKVPSTQKIVQKKDPMRVTQAVDPGKKASAILDLIRKALIQEIAVRFAAQPESFESPSIMRYPPGGKYVAHADGEMSDVKTGQWYRSLNRDVSLLLYLNDDYEGGELNFPHLNYSLKPKAGDLAFFPPNHIFIHESTSVKSGAKYAVVSWARFMGTPRIATDGPEDATRLIGV